MKSTDLSQMANPPMTLQEVLAEREKHRYDGGGGKGPSRLEQDKADKPLTVVDDKTFKAIVRKRDKLRCRKCGRKVIVQMARDPSRAEVHHLHGRLGDFRFDDRFALLACMECHEQLTGKVNTKFITVGTVFIEIKGQPCIDARQPVKFERVA